MARRAAREVSDRLRASLPGSSPRLIWLRTSQYRGTHALATALLRRWDDGFDGHGFRVAEILAGFRRRGRRAGRPTGLLLDDVAVSVIDLVPVLRAVVDPDRFLPEGEDGLPPFYTLVAGRPEALDHLNAGLAVSGALVPWVPLLPYSDRALEAIVRDRAERALGQPLPSELLGALVLRTVEEGGGARRAIELLRRAVLGRSVGAVPRFASPVSAGVSVEPRVVRAIDAATGGVAARLGEVRRLEAELARAQGVRPLPTTTLWRRILRLEAAGYVRREIRAGGERGTRSLVRVLTPIEEWVTAPGRTDTPQASGPSVGFAGGPEGDPTGRPPPGPERALFDVGAD